MTVEMDADAASDIGRGDRLPRVRVVPPGPESRALCRRLVAAEAPGINTVAGGEPTVVWREARGANVLDADGNLYLDLTSGFGAAAVGHRHPRVVAAVRRQAGRLLHGLGDVHAHPLRPELAERLASLAPVAHPPGEAAAVHFAVSGAEAVEIAIKTALLATGRTEAIAFDPAYHGLTLGALALTSRPAFRAPFESWLAGTVHRLPYGCDPADLARRLDSHPAIACCVFEPIAGREGVLVPPPGWLPAVVAACRDRGVLTIADEIFTGLGRTGRWFAVEHEHAAAGLGADLRPDLLVCGKALGGGLPIAAVIARRSLMAAWATPGEALHTSTFVANPLACAAALAVLDLLETRDLPARADRLGQSLGSRLATWPERFPTVENVRGRGLMWGIVLTGRAAAARLVHDASRQGALLLAGGPEGRVAQILPPLTITRRQLDHAVDLLEATLAKPATNRKG